MNKSLLILILLALLLGGFLFFTKTADKSEELIEPTIEQAEEVGLNFFLDFVAVAPPNEDQSAEERIYASLSENAKTKISVETLPRDMAGFVGVQDVPDQGISIVKVESLSEDRVLVTVGLNFSGGKVLRDTTLVIEDGMWKVDSVAVVE